MATGLQVLLLAALARLGEWPESEAAPYSLQVTSENLGTPGGGGIFFLLWPPCLTPNSDLCSGTEGLEGCSTLFTLGLKCYQDSE